MQPVHPYFPAWWTWLDRGGGGGGGGGELGRKLEETTSVMCTIIAVLVSYPDPDSQQLLIDYITAMWKVGLEEWSF